MDIEVRRIAQLGLIIIAVAFGGFGLWAALAPLHGAVVAAGAVKVDNNRKTVQHNEGGIIKEIYVHEGDFVRKDAPLILLDDAEIHAGYSVLRNALDVELARQARLHAESVGARRLDFPNELLQRSSDQVASQAMAREQAIFIARRSTLDTQVQLLQQQITQVVQEIQALSRQFDAEKEARTLSEEELRAYEQLQEKQFISGTRVLGQKRMVAEYQSRAEERRADIARAAQHQDDLKLRITSLQSDYSRVATEDLKTATARIAELRERLRPSEDAMRRQTIAAPVSGRVLGLRVHTPGGAIGPREPLMEIVPDQGPLVIEARVGPDAIKELQVGQGAEIRFTALPYRSTPLVRAKLLDIAADTQIDQQGVPYYLLKIEPDPQSLQRARTGGLQPGMVAEVYIQTEARTALEYLLKPVSDALLRAFRER